MPSYLLHIVFSSSSILQYYIKFDSCTIVMLEKLLGIRFFNIMVGHLVCCQITLPTSLKGLRFLLVA